MTRTTAVMGSPLYMPPEQMAASRNVDARSDIWALGVILYELLTGKAPFFGETLPEVCMKIATEPPPPIRSLRPDVPPEVEAVILRCLEKDRERRYGNIAQFAHALVDFGPKRARSSVERITRTIQAAGLSASALDLPPSSDASSGAAQAATAGTGTAAPWGRTTTGQPKGKRAVAVVGGAVLVAALGALVFGLKRGQPSVVSPEVSSAAANGVAPSAVVAPSVSVVPSAVEPAVTATTATTVVPPPSASPPPAVPSAHVSVATSFPVKNQGHSVTPSGATKHPTSGAATPVAATARPAQKGNIFDDR
jgi:serine/threonine protein kinase